LTVSRALTDIGFCDETIKLSVVKIREVDFLY
jgi:hypothetical protein